MAESIYFGLHSTHFPFFVELLLNLEENILRGQGEKGGGEEEGRGKKNEGGKLLIVCDNGSKKRSPQF